MNNRLVEKILRGCFILVFVLGTASMPGRGALAQVPRSDVLYTTDADFDQGTLVSVNHNAPDNDQLQLDAQTRPFPFINVAASGRGTMIRTDTETGEVVGEYRTAPEGRGLNPSRTTVDLFGNVWTANRDEVRAIDGLPHGSTVKIGLIVGGTRVDDAGEPNPDGGYLSPPFDYNTCTDRNGDGLIRTSQGLGDILDWPDITDGLGGTDGLVEDAVDECILIYQRLPDAEQARHVSVDADNNVWVGGYPFLLRMFYKLDGATGEILDAFDARDIGCGGYGGLIDGNGILWSVGGALLRYDPAAHTGFCIQQYGYGLGIDTNGYIWMSLWDGGIVKIAPDGTVVPGFPKPTFPTTTTTLLQATEEMSAVHAPVAPSPVYREAGTHQSGPELHEPDRASSPNSPDAKDFDLEHPLQELPQALMQALSEPLAGDPSVTFWVSPVDDWVQSSSTWTPGATVSLTIEDGNTVVYSDSQTADGSGSFNFDLSGAFDLQRGQTVTVDDGTTIKTHTVMPLYVDYVDVTAETISGRGAANTAVDVWVHGNGSVTATADGSGNWTADFSGQTDLTYFSDGGLAQSDDDGDATGVWWNLPAFRVNPDDDWVESRTSWTPDATITLTIEEGGVEVYSDTRTADSHGNFNFYLWDIFDLQRGQVVTVSDENYTKTHTITDLYVDTINVSGDTLSGRAAAGSSLDVWVNSGGELNLAADGSGNWFADFSGTTDITYLSNGSARQMDEDNDVTRVDWSAPRIQVAPEDDWVQSWSRWTPGSTITLTIADGGSVVYSDSQVADSSGGFNFNLWDVFDLQRGQVVTVSDGTNTKTHSVMPLYVEDIDFAADTISGRGEVGKSVHIWVHGDGDQYVTVAGDESWTADFSAQTDLTALSDGGSQQEDDDGDATGVWWSSPKIEVSPQDEWVQSWNRWAPDTTVTLTIEDGGAVVYSDSQTTDSHGNFHFGLWDIFDVQRDQLVTVTDGTTTKTHTVAALYVDNVDRTTDTVSGRADATMGVEVWVNNDGGLSVTPDGSGNWSADFSTMTDLTFLTDGGSRQVDEDGDTTHVSWSSPRFWVAPDDNWVQSWGGWGAGADITLTIQDSGTVLYSDTQIADDDGYFNFNLWNSGFRLQRGQEVTVSDGTTSKTHTVMPLYVDSVNVAADTLSGRGDPGADVTIWVHGDGERTVTPVSSGDWTADFSGMTDLTYLTDGGSRQFDSDGDGTGVWWAAPRFQVAPDDEWVQSIRPWRPGAMITLTIEDSGTVVYSASQVTDESGSFNFNLWDLFDLQRGQVVTVSDGTITKTHTIMPLYVDNINVTADTISGRGEAGADVHIWVHGDGHQYVNADAGNWTADFSTQTDLTYFNDGGSEQVDDDGDSTGVWWWTPSFQVTPGDATVNVWNRWKPETIVTLTVESGGVVVQSESQTTDVHGNFNFNVWSVDLNTAPVITVTDGAITKTHQVNNVSVTDIDVDADLIRGTANAGASVRVRAYDFINGSERTVTADAAGDWAADFSTSADGQPVFDITDLTFINVNEFDEDGDSTSRRFGPPQQQNRGVAVTPLDNNVWVANSAYGTVTRLDNEGNVLKAIDTGLEPTGVAVDASGKVWATNMGSNNVVRIDPAAGPDALGAVDLTVDLGQDASPYNYSDMTGAVAVGSTSPQGFWTVIQDSGTPSFEWGRIAWNTEAQGREPAGTAIIVEARAADTEAGLGGQAFQPVVNGELFSMLGRYIEVRVTLKASPAGASPVLSDIRIQPHVIYVGIDIKPGSFPNAINCRDKREVVSVAILTTEEFDALSVDHTTVTFEGASEIHVDRRTGLPLQHVEDVGLDGDMDLLFHFYRAASRLNCDSTSGQLTGLTFDGIPIEGTDSVWMVTR